MTVVYYVCAECKKRERVQWPKNSRVAKELICDCGGKMRRTRREKLNG